MQMAIELAGKAYTINTTEKDAIKILKSKIRLQSGKKMRRVSVAIHDMTVAIQEAGVNEALAGSDVEVDVDLQHLYESTIKAVKHMLASRYAGQLEREKVLLLVGPYTQIYITIYPACCFNGIDLCCW